MTVTAGLIALLAVVLGAQLLALDDVGARARRAAGPVLGGARGAKAHARRGLDAHRRLDVAPRRTVLVAAVIVGATLRLLFVIWATRQPTGMTDPAEYLRIASGFGHGQLPRFGGGGGPSDYWPPGYPALLAPFVWIAERTGWTSPAFTAALVNVVAGTATIALSAFLADRWIGRPARNVAAWLVAVCPALVYWTATAHSETVFTPMFLGVIVLSTLAAHDGSRRRWLLVGLLVGAAFLVRTPAAIGFVVPALTIRAASGSWRGATRATGLVVLASLALLVPWTIRNGVQVGIWTPASTNNAGAVCFGHSDGAQTLWDPSRLSTRAQVHCYRNSPFDDRRLLPVYETAGSAPAGIELGTPDEARWYRETMADAARWAVGHPRQELRLSTLKTWNTWRNEGRVVDGARTYSRHGWAGRWHGPLQLAANLWLWIVGTLALLGLLAVPTCRRALPIWAPIVLLTLAIVGGIAEPHYRYPVTPLVAVLAAGFVAPPAGRRFGRPAAVVPVRSATMTDGTIGPED